MTTKAAKQQEKTAAERYEEAVEKQFEIWLDESFSREALKGVPLYEHPVPSGTVFKVRNLAPEFLIQSGAVPVGSLSDEVLSKAPVDDLTPEAQMQRQTAEWDAMTPPEKLRRMQIVAKQIRYICVEPRLVLGDVNGHRNAMSVSQLRGPDFISLAARSNVLGGAAAPGLRTFRKRRR